MHKVKLLFILLIFPISLSANAQDWRSYIDGSWKLTCKDYDIDKALRTGLLTAQCRMRTSGQYKHTFVDLKQCTKELENIDGNLICK